MANSVMDAEDWADKVLKSKTLVLLLISGMNSVLGVKGLTPYTTRFLENVKANEVCEV